MVQSNKVKHRPRLSPLFFLPKVTKSSPFPKFSRKSGTPGADRSPGLERRHGRVAGLKRLERKAGAQALGIGRAAVRVKTQALGQENRDRRQSRQAQDEHGRLGERERKGIADAEVGDGPENRDPRPGEETPARGGDHLRIAASIRFWGRVTPPGQAEARVLRVVTLEDGETMHNAFFDRGFREDAA